MPFVEIRKCNICKKGFGEQECYVECDNCKLCFHLSCKKIEQNITRAKAKDNWFCSQDCKQARGLSDSQTIRDIEISKENPKMIDMLTSINVKMDKLSSDCLLIQTAQSEMVVKVNKIEASYNSLVSKFDELEVKFNSIIVENQELKEDKVKDRSLIFYLESQLDQIKQQKLDNNVLIAGIPNKDIHPEQIFEKITNVLKLSLSINDLIKLEFIDTSKEKHLKSQQQHNSNPLLLINFKQHSSKTLFMQKKKEIKMIFAEQLGFDGFENQIYFRDHLTSFKSYLLREARIIKNNNNYKYLWVKDGSIFMRQDDKSKVFSIRSKNDLHKLSSLSNK